jgi:CRISPR/Cas system CMR-associated protein Cmr5 small subunit
MNSLSRKALIFGWRLSIRKNGLEMDLSTKADKLLLINHVKWVMGDKDAFGKRINNVTSATITREEASSGAKIRKLTASRYSLPALRYPKFSANCSPCLLP